MIVWIAVQVVWGWYVADLISALVHLTIDKLYGTRCQHWPVLGKTIVEFHEHHENPKLMLTRGFWASSRDTILFSLLGVGLACLFWPWFWGTVAVGTGLCQAIHKAAHRERVPFWLRWLRQCDLLLRPQLHDVHHNGVFDRNFGIVNGWSNPLVNFFVAQKREGSSC